MGVSNLVPASYRIVARNRENMRREGPQSICHQEDGEELGTGEAAGQLGRLDTSQE